MAIKIKLTADEARTVVRLVEEKWPRMNGVKVLPKTVSDSCGVDISRITKWAGASFKNLHPSITLEDIQRLNSYFKFDLLKDVKPKSFIKNLPAPPVASHSKEVLDKEIPLHRAPALTATQQKNSLEGKRASLLQEAKTMVERTNSYLGRAVDIRRGWNDTDWQKAWSIINSLNGVQRCLTELLGE